MISWTCSMTPSIRSLERIAPLSTRIVPWRLPTLMPSTDSSSARYVMFPLRSNISPSRSSVSVEVAKISRPSDT